MEASPQNSAQSDAQTASNGTDGAVIDKASGTASGTEPAKKSQESEQKDSSATKPQLSAKDQELRRLRHDLAMHGAKTSQTLREMETYRMLNLNPKTGAHKAYIKHWLVDSNRFFILSARLKRRHKASPATRP